MTYSECRDKLLYDIIKEFKQGKLKLQNGKKVTEKKQAIAIALNMAQLGCRYSKKDMEEVEKKVIMFLKEDKRKIAKTRIPLTNVIETKVLIKNLVKMKKKGRAHMLYMMLVKRVVMAGADGIKVSQNIFEELEEISKLV